MGTSSPRVDFHGKCEMPVPLSRAQEENLPAWDFRVCTGAPVTLRWLVGDQERWIVVVSSLNGEDFTEPDAFERAAREVGDGMLWSSYYPSLNPDLWVVSDGPDNDESSACAAATTDVARPRASGFCLTMGVTAIVSPQRLHRCVRPLTTASN